MNALSTLTTLHLKWCLFWRSRLVVWCLRSLQFEWDVLPARPELKSIQRNQMVLLERLGLFTAVHHDDDETSRLYWSPLNRWENVAKKTATNKTKNKKYSREPKHIVKIFVHAFVHVYMFNNLAFAKIVKYGLKPEQNGTLTNSISWMILI